MGAFRTGAEGGPGMQAQVAAAANAAIALQDRLETLGSRSLVVPVKWRTKIPDVPEHKGNAWKVENSMQYFTSYQPKPFFVGLLLSDLCVIDFDDRLLYVRMCREFPEILEAPAERTKNGVHVFFWRSARMDELAMHDGPLRDPETRENLRIDFKTITSSVHNGHKTRALVVVTPSEGKSWMKDRSLFEVAPFAPSERLTEWIRKRLGVKKYRAKVSETERKPENRTGLVPHAEPAVSFVIGGFAARIFGHDELFIKPVESADRADTFLKLETGAPTGRVTSWVNGAYSGFSFKAGGKCPCCKRTRPHNNQYYIVHRTDGVRRLYNHGCNSPIVIEYTEASARNYTNLWRQAANMAFKKLDLEVAVALSKCASSLEDLEPVNMWYDSETCVAYAELGRKFVAVGLDSDMGRDWISSGFIRYIRVTERPSCFGDLSTGFSAVKTPPDEKMFRKFCRVLGEELDL